MLQQKLKECLISFSNFFPWTIQAFVYSLSRHRSKEQILTDDNKTRLKSIVYMLECLDIYSGVFEQAIISSTQEFHGNEWNHLVQTIPNLSVVYHINHILSCLDDETKNLIPLFLPQTRDCLENILLVELVRKHSSDVLYGIENILSSRCGIYYLIKNEEISLLNSIYSLYQKIANISEFKRAWQLVIKAEGFRILQEKLQFPALSEQQDHSPDSFERLYNSKLSTLQVPSLETLSRPGPHRILAYELIKFKLQLSRIQLQVFNDAPEFDAITKDAWFSFLSLTPALSDAVACLVARYADELLKSNDSAMNIETAEIHLDRLLMIFKFTQSKDVFKAYYEKDFGKRLLYNNYISTEHEKLAIKKIRDECGPGYTSRIESMFRELKASRKTYVGFRKYPEFLALEEKSGISFDCRVLASGIWPISPKASCESPKIPDSIVELQNCYEQFYEQLYKGRKIKWVYSLGMAVISASFGGKDSDEIRNHDLVVSQYQALCLDLFNYHNTLTVTDIAKKLNIPTEELEQHVVALYADPKCRILLKNPPGLSEPNESDEYSVNENFTYHLPRVPVPQIWTKEIKEEAQTTEIRLEEDRSYHIDALIVRLMKQNKTMTEIDLVQQVLDQTMFVSTLPAVKFRIDTLVEREFLSQDPDNPNIYSYVI